MSWAYIGAAAVTTVGGAVAGNASKPDNVPGRNLGQELSQLGEAMPGLARTSYGIASEYLPQYTALDLQRDSTARRSVLGDVAGLSGQMRNIRRDYAPETQGLLDQLVAKSRGDLASGGRLSASELRDSQQQVRSGWSARGLGGSAAGVADEILNADSLRRRRQLEAQQLGLSTVGVAQNYQGDPLQSILGIPTAGTGRAAYASADPGNLLGYAQDVNDTNFNAAASAANAAANNRAEIYGGVLDTAGDIYGAYLGNRAPAGG